MMLTFALEIYTNLCVCLHGALKIIIHIMSGSSFGLKVYFSVFFLCSALNYYFLLLAWRRTEGLRNENNNLCVWCFMQMPDNFLYIFRIFIHFFVRKWRIVLISVHAFAISYFYRFGYVIIIYYIVNRYVWWDWRKENVINKA